MGLDEPEKDYEAHTAINKIEHAKDTPLTHYQKAVLESLKTIIKRLIL